MKINNVRNLLLFVIVSLPAFAQGIQDNSFLAEEAYNQEPGVVQHIFNFQRAQHGGDWIGTFTQEWPMGSLQHQISYTIVEQRADGERSRDFALNYRYQLVGNGESKVAIAPRVSIFRSRKQVMIPVSIVVSPHFVTHWDLGATSNPRTINAAQSVVWLVSERFNALVETAWNGANHNRDLVISPGIRWAYNFPSKLQIVPGIAIPFDRTTHSRSIFLYLSFEHPFIRGGK